MTTDATSALVNPKHRRFVEAYRAFGGNGTRAAIEAGYSERRARQTAHEILGRPEVQAALAADAPGVVDVDPAYLVESLIHFIEKAKAGEVPASAGIRAIETLGRWRGLERRITETYGEERKVVVTMALGHGTEAA